MARGLSRMTFLHFLPQIRIAIVGGFGIFLAGTMLVSAVETLETMKERLMVSALLLTGCALSAWLVMSHTPG